jgi:hypothetical protein
MKSVQIASHRIKDWDSFFRVFKEAFGFPDFFGNNMDAWIDCMSDLSTTIQKGMTEFEIEHGDKVILDIPEADEWKKRCPDIFEAFIECTSFANYRNLKVGEDAPLLLFLH